MEQERYLDVSDLEPPEPLLRALKAINQLTDGQYLHFRHRLKPCLLYDNLADCGFDSDTREGEHGMCEVFIWRIGDSNAENMARSAAAMLPRWQD